MLKLLVFLCVVVGMMAQQPKNVIFLIGDGMGLGQLTLASHEKGSPLAVERIKVIGLHKNASSDSKVTDSAAGATAFSIGKKTYNGAIGIDAEKKAHPTLLELAEKKGLATGLVATASITHATPASFIAHQESRKMDKEIARDFLNTDIDVVIGGGQKYFEKEYKNSTVLELMKSNGYTYVTSLEAAKTANGEKLLALTHEKHVPEMRKGRGDYLLEATKISLDRLSKNKNGFFVMIEASQIDWGGHAGEADYVREEILDFDKVIDYVLDFADKNGETLVVITADHETGGLIIQGEEKAEYKFTSDKYAGISTSYKHTGVMIPVYAYGNGAEAFGGIYQNTAIFDKIKTALGL